MSKMKLQALAHHFWHFSKAIGQPLLAAAEVLQNHSWLYDTVALDIDFRIPISACIIK